MDKDLGEKIKAVGQQLKDRDPSSKVLILAEHAPLRKHYQDYLKPYGIPRLGYWPPKEKIKEEIVEAYSPDAKGEYITFFQCNTKSSGKTLENCLADLTQELKGR